MPLVTMRQLLDEAAKGGYGVGAFNVNNLEQSRRSWRRRARRSHRSYPGLARGAQVRQRPVPVPPHAGRCRGVSRDPAGLAPGHGNSPETCRSAMELGLTAGMMAGLLMEDGKTRRTSSTTCTSHARSRCPTSEALPSR